ncbi:tetratricopeptide repeat protein 33 isoform X2 [Lampetra fluviatilis]
MTSFGWVKRSGSVLKPRISLGEDDDDDDSGGGEVTLPIDKKRKHSQDGRGDGGGLGSGGDGDDGTSVTLRCCELRDEGARLAESGSLREALRLWDTAIAMTTNDAKIHEMKAQPGSPWPVPSSTWGNLPWLCGVSLLVCIWSPGSLSP